MKVCVSNLSLCQLGIVWITNPNYACLQNKNQKKVSRAHKLVHFGWGVLLLHAVKRRFREPGCTLCKTTSMRNGEDNRLALMPLLRLP